MNFCWAFKYKNKISERKQKEKFVFHFRFQFRLVYFRFNHHSIHSDFWASIFVVILCATKRERKRNKKIFRFWPISKKDLEKEVIKWQRELTKVRWIRTNGERDWKRFQNCSFTPQKNEEKEREKDKQRKSFLRVTKLLSVTGVFQKKTESERERETEIVCVCVCVSDRERERERDGLGSESESVCLCRRERERVMEGKDRWIRFVRWEKEKNSLFVSG